MNVVPEPESADPDDAAAKRARLKRPPGWVAPGPRPRGAHGRADLAPTADEDLSFLCGDFRIFQRKDGHRWSLDDFVTAAVAVEEGRARGIGRALDLGCGIGSVLLMTAWAFPEAQLLGIEAQALSAALARRSIAFDGVGDRVRLIEGDLREVIRSLEERFDLVTGTPPYIPLGHGVVSEKVQKGPCCFETRGGIEDYTAAAAEVLAPGGVFVACAGAKPPGRSPKAAEQAGLAVARHVEVIPRDGKAPLFTVTAMVHPADFDGTTRLERFVVRDEKGAITPQMHRARELMGMPPVG